MLGLPQLAGGVGEVFRRVGSRLLNGLDLTGRFPGLQPQPPVVPLSDPANLEPTAPPAVQAAAEIKAEEDAAPQKIMAIRYLATLGCGGCYEKVENALLEAMSDCTEEVRFEAVKALRCRPDCGCKFCTSPSCCSEPVRKRLEELTTCEKEPSERINRMARLALACCNTKPLKSEDVPREGPTPAPAQEATAASILNSAPADDPLVALSADIPLLANPNSAVPGAATPGAVATASYVPNTDRVIALVNDQQILESQLKTFAEVSLKTGKAPANIDRQLLFKVELQRMIDLMLVQQFMQLEQSQLMQVSTATAAAASLTPAQTQNWLERKLAVDPNVAPLELLAYYQVHQQEYLQPARVRWESLTVLSSQCKTRELASEVAAFAKSRAEGLQVAPPSSFMPAMIQSQVMPWQPVNQLSKQLEEVISTLHPGQVSQPFQQGGDLCIVRLLAREEIQPIPLNAVAGKISQTIVSQRRKVALDRFLAQARANSRIWNSLENNQPPVTSPVP